jgi:hypothetical protein
MLTGHAFARQTVSDTIAAILERSRTGAHCRPIPPTIDRLLRRCLEKNPEARSRMSATRERIRSTANVVARHSRA